MRKLFAALLATAALASPAVAQESHGIVAVVNDDIISTHDLRQRVLFLLATTGAERDEASLARLQQQALRNLVDERLQVQESNKYEQTISDEQIDNSVQRLIARNNLSADEVVQRLASVGVSIDTLREQRRAEIGWQRIINGLYGSRIRISDAQIDETLSRLTANAAKPSYRVAEIFIEATPDIGGMEGALGGAEAMIAQINQGAPFPLLAQQFSSAPSAANGGDIGFVSEGELRPELDAVVASLEPGTVSDPIETPGGYYVLAVLEKRVSQADTVYRLRQINSQLADGGDASEIETRFRGYKTRLTSCDTLADDVAELEGVNTSDMGQIKASEMTDDIRTLISGLTEGQLSDPLVTPQGVVALMVCEAEVSGSGIPTREQIEDRLLEQQLAQASRKHLRDLRRKAAIVTR